MKGKHLFMAILGSIGSGVSFGLWIENMYAGFFMLSLVYNIFIIRYH